MLSFIFNNHAAGDNFCRQKCWNTKKNGFHSKEKFRLKGGASTKKKWLLVIGVVSNMGNDFHEKQKLSLKGTTSTTGNGLKGLASNKSNSFQ